MSRTRQGFTLVELIVVITILAVLAAITYPVSSRVIQSGKASACVSNLRAIGAGLQLYLGDHNQIMPPHLWAGRKSISDDVPVIDNTLNVYVSDPRVFACPADNLGIAAGTGTSYFWNSGLDGQSTAQLHFLLSPSGGQNSEIPVLSDKQGFHPYISNKVNLLYADGHASQDLIFSTSQ
jgi:prepilin-type N-terminal cleavage/methylation domain-containing protein/prepilin-type processing-associated H-X9-DG protein